MEGWEEKEAFPGGRNSMSEGMEYENSYRIEGTSG